MKCKFFIALITFAFVSINAQETVTIDSAKKTNKAHYKYIGIQANLLLQQFISFNSNSSINTNPYLFSFVNSNIKTGAGFVFGTGFNISSVSSNDGVSAQTVDNANLAFRLGGEKKYFQNEKFIPFWGLELGFGGTYNKVTSQLNQTFSTTITTVTTNKYFFGPSFRGGLLFALSKHILIGTETFFNVQVATTIISNNNGFGNGTNTANSFAPFNIGFQAPTALFLIFKY